MGFEPFILPKRTEKQAEPTNREDKVLSLAKLLHSRGITSSLTDAKRLAEGMVDVERKVMKQPPKPEAAPQPAAKSAAPAAVPKASSSKLPDDFAQFVAKAAAISHDQISSPVPVPQHTPVSFGREIVQTLAEVPHTTARKQVMYDEAPDMTKLRGYKGPAPKPVDFPSQRMESLRVSTGDTGIKVTRTEVAPAVEIVEEKVIIAEPETTLKPTPQAPSAADLLAEEMAKDETVPEQTMELPKSEKPRENEDLAKKHGVDLFNMFKVNK